MTVRILGTSSLRRAFTNAVESGSLGWVSRQGRMWDEQRLDEMFYSVRVHVDAKVRRTELSTPLLEGKIFSPDALTRLPDRRAPLRLGNDLYRRARQTDGSFLPYWKSDDADEARGEAELVCRKLHLEPGCASRPWMGFGSLRSTR